MRSNTRRHRVVLAGVALLVAAALASGDNEHAVPYPEGFRAWQHVKSDIVGPTHPSFPVRGGIHHFYANSLAVEGFPTGRFPKGAVLVDEAVFTKEGEGPAAGILLEGDRRSVEVMVKDDALYGETGGWGFEHFEGNSRVGRLAVSDKASCFACHSRRKDRDLVFSSIRP
jgi:hypothetical protein